MGWINGPALPGYCLTWKAMDRATYQTNELYQIHLNLLVIPIVPS